MVGVHGTDANTANEDKGTLLSLALPVPSPNMAYGRIQHDGLAGSMFADLRLIGERRQHGRERHTEQVAVLSHCNRNGAIRDTIKALIFVHLGCQYPWPFRPLLTRHSGLHCLHLISSYQSPALERPSTSSCVRQKTLCRFHCAENPYCFVSYYLVSTHDVHSLPRTYRP